MSNRILLLAGNFSPEPTGIGKYNGEMIDWLATNGFDCTVITTYPYYPQWKPQPPYQKKYRWYSQEILKTNNGNSVKILRCPHYIPAVPTGKTRMLLDFSFAFSSLLLLIKLAFSKKFRFVITVSPPLPLGILAAWYKAWRKAIFLYHIQDLQVDTAAELNMLKSKILLKFLFATEKYILKRADIVSTISDGMIKRIVAKTGREVLFFPNWSDTAQIFPIENKAALKTEFGFNTLDTVLLYSGAIGEKQGLESIIYTAADLQHIPGLQFVICGSGPYGEKLQQLAKSKNLKNIKFIPIQPLEKLNRFLNMADVHFVIQKSNASDLVMPSKLTNILAVGGLAIITANEGSSLHTLVKKYNMGILVNAEDQAALSMAVTVSVDDNAQQLKINARKYAESYLSINTVMQTYIEQSGLGKEV